MPDEIDLAINSRSKWILRLFTRHVGLVEVVTYETPQELADKFFPDKTMLRRFVGRDSVDQGVDHWFNDSGTGEVIMMTVTQFLGPKKVQPADRLPGPRA